MRQSATHKPSLLSGQNLPEHRRHAEDGDLWLRCLRPLWGRGCVGLLLSSKPLDLEGADFPGVRLPLALLRPGALGHWQSVSCPHCVDGPLGTCDSAWREALGRACHARAERVMPLMPWCLEGDHRARTVALWLGALPVKARPGGRHLGERVIPVSGRACHPRVQSVSCTRPPLAIPRGRRGGVVPKAGGVRDTNGQLAKAASSATLVSPG